MTNLMTAWQWHTRTCDSDTAARELAVYDLALRYFDGVVPLTVATATGTARLHVAGRTAHELGDDLLAAVRTDRGVRGIADMVLLDLLTRNADRHGNNWVVGTQGAIWAIDNELAFSDVRGGDWALRPAYRACLLDDPEWAPLFAGYLTRRLDVLASTRGSADVLAAHGCELDVPAMRRWVLRVTQFMETTAT